MELARNQYMKLEDIWPLLADAEIEHVPLHIIFRNVHVSCLNRTEGKLDIVRRLFEDGVVTEHYTPPRTSFSLSLFHPLSLIDVAKGMHLAAMQIHLRDKSVDEKVEVYFDDDLDGGVWIGNLPRIRTADWRETIDDEEKITTFLHSQMQAAGLDPIDATVVVDHVRREAVIIPYFVIPEERREWTSQLKTKLIETNGVSIEGGASARRFLVRAITADNAELWRNRKEDWPNITERERDLLERAEEMLSSRTTASIGNLEETMQEDPSTSQSVMEVDGDNEEIDAPNLIVSLDDSQYEDPQMPSSSITSRSEVAAPPVAPQEAAQTDSVNDVGSQPSTSTGPQETSRSSMRLRPTPSSMTSSPSSTPQGAKVIDRKVSSSRKIAAKSLQLSQKHQLPSPNPSSSHSSDLGIVKTVSQKSASSKKVGQGPMGNPDRVVLVQMKPSTSQPMEANDEDQGIDEIVHAVPREKAINGDTGEPIPPSSSAERSPSLVDAHHSLPYISQAIPQSAIDVVGDTPSASTRTIETLTMHPSHQQFTRSRLLNSPLPSTSDQGANIPKITKRQRASSKREQERVEKVTQRMPKPTARSFSRRAATSSTTHAMRPADVQLFLEDPMEFGDESLRSDDESGGQNIDGASTSMRSDEDTVLRSDEEDNTVPGPSAQLPKRRAGARETNGTEADYKAAKMSRMSGLMDTLSSRHDDHEMPSIPPSATSIPSFNPPSPSSSSADIVLDDANGAMCPSSDAIPAVPAKESPRRSRSASSLPKPSTSDSPRASGSVLTPSSPMTSTNFLLPLLESDPQAESSNHSSSSSNGTPKMSASSGPTSKHHTSHGPMKKEQEMSQTHRMSTRSSSRTNESFFSSALAMTQACSTALNPSPSRPFFNPFSVSTDSVHGATPSPTAAGPLPPILPSLPPIPAPRRVRHATNASSLPDTTASTEIQDTLGTHSTSWASNYFPSTGPASASAVAQRITRTASAKKAENGPSTSSHEPSNHSPTRRQSSTLSDTTRDDGKNREERMQTRYRVRRGGARADSALESDGRDGRSTSGMNAVTATGCEPSTSTSTSTSTSSGASAIPRPVMISRPAPSTPSDRYLDQQMKSIQNEYYRDVEVLKVLKTLLKTEKRGAGNPATSIELSETDIRVIKVNLDKLTEDLKLKFSKSCRRRINHAFDCFAYRTPSVYFHMGWRTEVDVEVVDVDDTDEIDADDNGGIVDVTGVGGETTGKKRNTDPYPLPMYDTTGEVHELNCAEHLPKYEFFKQNTFSKGWRAYCRKWNVKKWESRCSCDPKVGCLSETCDCIKGSCLRDGRVDLRSNLDIVVECCKRCPCKGKDPCPSIVKIEPVKLHLVKLEGMGFALRIMEPVERGQPIVWFTGVYSSWEELSGNDKDWAYTLANGLDQWYHEYVGIKDRDVAFLLNPLEKGNAGRFICHSFNPNAGWMNVYMGGASSVEPRVFTFAAEPIHAGDLLYLPYGPQYGIDRAMCNCTRPFCHDEKQLRWLCSLTKQQAVEVFKRIWRLKKQRQMELDEVVRRLFGQAVQEEEEEL